MGGLGLPELLVILTILLLLFGSSRLPNIAKSIGQSGKELRDAFDSTNAKVADTKKEILNGLDGVSSKLADVNKEFRGNGTNVDVVKDTSEPVKSQPNVSG